MIVNNSVNQGYQNAKNHWLSQGIFVLVYSVVVGFLILPFAFFVAITSTILDEGGENEFSGASVLFWISIAILVLAGIMFVAMLMGTLQHRALEKDKSQTFMFEEALKHSFTNGRFRSYAIFSGYFFLINALIGLISWVLREGLGLNETHDYGILDIIMNTISLIVMIILLSTANLSALAIAEGEATSDAFVLGWKKFYNRIIDLFAINSVAMIPLAITITITALVGVLLGEVGPEDTNEDESAGELVITFSLILIIIIVQLFLLFFVFPLYAAIVAKGAENSKTKPLTDEL